MDFQNQIAATIQLKKRGWGTRLSPLPWYESKWKIAGTPDWSGLVSPPIASVFVGSRLAMVLLPPAEFMIEVTDTKNSKTNWAEVLHLFRCVTHTHTRAQTGFSNWVVECTDVQKSPHIPTNWEEGSALELGKLAADATHALIWS